MKLFAIRKYLFFVVAWIGLHLGAPAHAGPFTIGIIGDSTGDIVEGFVSSISDDVNIQIVRGSASDTSFFDQLDAFVFADAFGSTRRSSLGATGRANFLNFVLGGGHAYLGIGSPGTSTDGSAVAALFGLGQSAEVPEVQMGTILDPTHPIASGPFQPATDYRNSFFRTLSLPGNAIELGRSPSGTTVAFFAEDALGAGSGQVYFFADEVPLSSAFDHSALFTNALIGFGATQVPEPNGLMGLAFGLLGFAGIIRRRVRS